MFALKARLANSISSRTLRFLARLAFWITIIVVAIALLHGRWLEQNVPWIVDLVTYFGIFLIVAIVLFTTEIGLVFSSLMGGDNRKDFVRLWVISILALIAGVGLCEALIQFPLERLHFIKYGLLTFFGFFAQQPKPFRARLGTAMLITFCVGTVEESMQWFLPLRVFDWRDLRLNYTGLGYGAFFSWLSCRWIALYRLAKLVTP